MQCAWHHDCRGVQKYSLRYPKKHVLKNTEASGGAGAAQLLHRLQQLVCYSRTLSKHSTRRWKKVRNVYSCLPAGAKILRLVGFVWPLKTELESHLKLCRNGRTMECRMRRERTDGSVCDRGKADCPKGPGRIELSERACQRTETCPVGA